MSVTPHPGLAGSSLQRVRDALAERGSRHTLRGDHIQAQCLAHEDREPSLSIDYKPSTGSVLMHCHGGCAVEDILESLGLDFADLYDESRPDDDSRRHNGGQVRRANSRTRTETRRPAPAPKAPKAPPCVGLYERHAYREVTRYLYTDEQDTVLGCRVRRMCHREGCGHKNFYWMRVEASGNLGKGGLLVPQPLYNLPVVLHAVADRRPVWVLEGEKDADTATALGVVATTNGAADDGGGNHWKAHHTAALAGGDVVICRDRDEPGRRHSLYVGRQLLEAGCRVRLVEPAHGKDLTDHHEAGGGLDDLVDVTEELEAALSEALPNESGGSPVRRHGGDGDAQAQQERDAPDDSTLIDLTAPAHLRGDDEPPTGDAMDHDVDVPDRPLDMDYHSAADKHFRQYGPRPTASTRARRDARLVEVVTTSRTDTSGNVSSRQTEKPLLRGRLTVDSVYSLRELTPDCRPSETRGGTVYAVTFEPPNGEPSTARITDAELRATRDLEWPGELGIDPYVETSTLKRIPDAVRAMALDRQPMEAFAATGLLLRPGREPVYLRQSAPALTGSPTRFAHDLVTQLPGEIESSPGLYHLSLADPSTPAQAGEDLQSWWAVREVARNGDTLVPLLLLALTVAAPWSSLPGMVTPAAYLDASTGSGKSALTGLVTAWQSSTFTPTPEESSAVVMSAESLSSVGSRSVLHLARGLTIPVDDFFPAGQSTAETAKQVAILNAIGRGTRSGAADVKAGRDGTLRAGKAMRAVPLVTGEAFTDPKSSQSARFIHGRLSREVLDLQRLLAAGERNEALDRAQQEVRHAARAHAALICDGLADLDAVRAAAAWASDHVRSWRIQGNTHLAAGYSGLMFGARLFAQRAARVADLDPAAVLDEFSEVFRRCALEQGSRSTSRSAIADRFGPDAERIVSTMRSLLLEGTFRLDGPELNTPPQVPGYAAAAFGWATIPGSRDSFGEPVSRPRDGLGNPLGTVHHYVPGTGGRPPAWPATARTNGSVVVRVTVDDWRRLYEVVAERGGGAMYLPDDEQARVILAEAGYMESAKAKPAPNGGSRRVLTLDLLRILAGEDGADEDGADNDDPGGPDTGGTDGDQGPEGDHGPNGATTEVSDVGDVSDALTPQLLPDAYARVDVGGNRTTRPESGDAEDPNPDTSSQVNGVSDVGDVMSYHSHSQHPAVPTTRAASSVGAVRGDSAPSTERRSGTPDDADGAGEQLAGVSDSAPAISDGESDVSAAASSQVTGVSDVGDDSDGVTSLEEVPMQVDAVEATCPLCREPMEAWRAEEGLTCLRCFELLRSFPAACPACRQQVASPIERAAFEGWHAAHAPVDVADRGRGRLAGQHPAPHAPPPAASLDDRQVTATAQTTAQTVQGPAAARQGAAASSRKPTTAPVQQSAPNSASGAGVLDVDRLFLPTEHRYVKALPPDLATAYRLAEALGLRQLWLTPAAAERLGLPQKVEGRRGAGEQHPWASLEGTGLRSDPDGGINHWVNVWPAATQATSTGGTPSRVRRIAIVLPHLNRDSWPEVPAGDVLIEALELFAHTLGVSWYMSAPIMFAQLNRAANQRRRGGQIEPFPAASAGELALFEEYRARGFFTRSSSRPLGGDEEGAVFVHRFDRNAAWPSVYESVELGVGDPTHLSGQDIDVRALKFGFVRPAAPAGRDLPLQLRQLLRLEDDRGEVVPLAMPEARLLSDLGQLPPIVEALVWRDTERALRSFGERLRLARKALAEEASPAALVAEGLVKGVANANGVLARRRDPDDSTPAAVTPDWLDRPDWRATVIAQASANQVRDVLKAGLDVDKLGPWASLTPGPRAGRWPVGFHIDAAYYLSDEPDPETALPTRMTYNKRGGGNWKGEGFVPLPAVRNHLGESSFAAVFRRELRRKG